MWSFHKNPFTCWSHFLAIFRRAKTVLFQLKSLNWMLSLNYSSNIGAARFGRMKTVSKWNLGQAVVNSTKMRIAEHKKKTKMAEVAGRHYRSLTPECGRKSFLRPDSVCALAPSPCYALPFSPSLGLKSRHLHPHPPPDLPEHPRTS